VPRNIRVIGTMNTADRSVAHLDAAVRRRFGFVSAPPDPSVLEAVVGPLNLASLLIVLNQRISEHLSRDHQLGHAHFMIDDAPVESAETLAAAFYQDVIPQLEDYALGDPSLLVRLLGADLVPNGEIASHESEDLLLILAKEFEAGETVVGA
jgi:5-methylcytosine-specific restriction protein B